jgi:hypothetical protein
MLLPAGCLLAGVAATAAVLTRSALVPWLIVLVVFVNVLAVARLVQRRRGGRPFIVFEQDRWVWAPAAAAAAAAAYGITELRRPDIAWDTRSIWFLHARLVDGGGHTYVAAMHSSAYSFSHTEYPLLIPGSVAEAWRVVGSRDYRLGQVIIGLLSASLLVVAGSLLGRVVRGRLRTPVGIVLAAALVFAAFWVSAANASNGLADLPAAAAAVAGAIALLVLPMSLPYVSVVGVLCVWITALTKTEGAIACVAIAALVVVRHLIESASQVPWRQRLLRGFGWGALLAGPPLVWLAFTAVEVTAPTYYGGIAPDHLSPVTRGHMALSILLRHMWMLAWLVPLIAFACVVLARVRRRWGIGSPVWLPLIVGLYLGGLVFAYATGPYAVAWWVGSSADRVTYLPRLLLLTELAVVVAVAVSGRPPQREGPAATQQAERDVRAGVPGTSSALGL